VVESNTKSINNFFTLVFDLSQNFNLRALERDKGGAKVTPSFYYPVGITDKDFLPACVSNAGLVQSARTLRREIGEFTAVKMVF
jgi:hypothetical protein